MATIITINYYFTIINVGFINVVIIINWLKNSFYCLNSLTIKDANFKYFVIDIINSVYYTYGCSCYCSFIMFLP